MCSKEHNEQEDRESLNKLRHSCEHIYAQAISELFPGKVKLAVAHIDENGFANDAYFDFSLSDKDFKKIEKKMKHIIKQNLPIIQKEVSQKEAREIFKDNKFKLGWLDDIVTNNEKITLFYTGDPKKNANAYVDLCKGPHVESTGKIKVFKLLKISGAYWRGDEKNEMLTRVYGVVFANEKELDDYLRLQEEAKRRDHRKLGKELDLFTFSELVGGGLPLFTPKGTLLRDLIVEKIQTLQKKFGYQKVTIPHITKKDLYEKSGHWAKFGDELFKVKGQSDQEFVMKPMNCPHHTQIYASRQRSYRDLPVRYMETTMVYRDEQAGELLGLSRVRSISQDDGHVFCTPAQIETEVSGIVSVIKDFYTSLNMFNEGDYWVSVSVRDPKTPEKYLGDPAKWDKAEKTLEDIAKKENLPYKRVEGEAAFYGPKLDFMFRDAIGREWQLATAQLDFVMPERFGLEYTDETNTKQTPVMLHRAIAGSLERFLSVIIEHFAGAFPFWLSPVQVVVIPVSDKFNDYGKDVCDRLTQENFRVELYSQSETLGKRIRIAQKEKTPYILVVGEKEVADKTVSIRSQKNDDEGTTSVDDLITKLRSQ
jgi:threonyl-tRNA synthetase